MHHETAASDEPPTGTVKGDVTIEESDLSNSIVIGVDVPKITRMTVGVGGPRVLFLIRIEVTAGIFAKVAKLSFFVHVEAVQTGSEVVNDTFNVDAMTLFVEGKFAVD